MLTNARRRSYIDASQTPLTKKADEHTDAARQDESSTVIIIGAPKKLQ